MSVQVVQLNLESSESLAFVGDLHGDSANPASRLDNYMQTTVFKLNDLREKCIANNVRVLLMAGDIFNRIQVTNECINLIGSEFLKFREAGIRVLTIIGNHDIPRNNLDYLVKSPLSLLFNFGIIEHIHLGNRVVVNKKGLITPVDYTESVVPATPNAKYNILLAHQFYGASELIGGKDNIRKEDIVGLGYNAMFLGHDHVNYPVINVDGTDIIRPGAVTRGTAHEYNFDRKVGFYVFRNSDQYSLQNWEFISLNVRPFQEVVSSRVLNKKSGLSNLSELMSELVVRLADKDDSKYDGILDRVMHDKELEESVRQLLLRYFSERGIASL